MPDTQLVIYYDEVDVDHGPSVTLDEFRLISAVPAAPAAATALEKAATAVEITKNVGEMVQKKDDPNAQPGASVNTITTSVKGEILIDMSMAGRYARTKDVLFDLNPWKETVVETFTTNNVKIEVTTTKTDYPLLPPHEESVTVVTPIPPPKVSPDGEQPPAPSSGNPDGGTGVEPPTNGTPDGGTVDTPDAGNKPVHLAPPDPAIVNKKVTEPFLKIMDDISSMTFTTSDDAKAYVEEELENAGIKVEITSTGLSVTEAGDDDPAGVGHQLRQRGLDDDIIKRVKEEANSIVAAFEQTISMVQGDLSGLDPDDPDLPAAFDSKIQFWSQEFEKLSTDLPTEVTDKPMASFGISNGTVVMTAPYEPPAQPGRTSPNGLIVRAGLGLRTSEGPTTANLAPGFHPGPTISLFDEEAWQLQA